MKYTRERFHAQSALGNYQVVDAVSGWQCLNYNMPSENIFKQLKVNLNKYEKKFHQQQSVRNKNLSQKLNPPRYLEQKQNEAKSPLIFHSTPLKHLIGNREPFQVKCRNILQDALAYNQSSEAKQFRITRLTKKRKMKSEDEKIGGLLKRTLMESDFNDSRLLIPHHRRLQQ